MTSAAFCSTRYPNLPRVSYQPTSDGASIGLRARVPHRANGRFPPLTLVGVSHPQKEVLDTARQRIAFLVYRSRPCGGHFRCARRFLPLHCHRLSVLRTRPSLDGGLLLLSLSLARCSSSSCKCSASTVTARAARRSRLLIRQCGPQASCPYATHSTTPPEETLCTYLIPTKV